MGTNKLQHDPDEYEYDFALRKCVHVRLFTGLYFDFKEYCVKHKFSMQETFNFLIEKLVNEDPRLVEMVKEYKKDKRNKKLRKISDGMDDLYDAMQDNSPFKDEQ